MSHQNLAAHYRAYIACLNARDLRHLGDYVHEQAEHNGMPFGLAGYRAMLEGNYRDIPDLRFQIEQMVVEDHRVAARLLFNCTPAGMFLGMAVNGRRVSFHENVFYAFHEGKIRRVWSLIDTAAIAAQLSLPR